MMVQTLLSLRFLGPIEALFHEPGRTSPALRRKEWALLAYLAASGQTHRRSRLAGLFCQEAEVPARALRVLLSRIRHQLRSDLILAEGDTIRFNHSTAWVDYLEFTRTLEGDLARQSLPQLEMAIRLYRGEFIEGVNLPDSAEFEIWLLGQRTRTHRLYERGLSEIITRLIVQESYEAAIHRVQQLLQSSPLLEEAHAQLIWLYVQLGQPEAALAQYELCRELLWRELAVEPSPELKALYGAATAGRPVVTFSSPRLTLNAATLPPAPDFVGREAELEQLQQAWEMTLAGRGNVILVAAVAGGGKTRLVQEFGQQLPPGSFLAGRCYESTTTLPYHPWPDIVEMHLSSLEKSNLKRLSPFTQGYLARLAPGLIQESGQRFLKPLSVSGSAGQELECMFTAVRDLVAPPADRGMPGRPLLIFFDDLQWAGQTSLRLFHFLACRASSARLLLVGTYRSEELEDAPALQTLLTDLKSLSPRQLWLSFLTPTAVNLLVRQLWPNLPEGYRPHVTAMLAQATGGNPLFVTELIRELSSTALVPAELPVPDSIQALIHRRLDQLPHNSRQVIEALAILQGATTLNELRQISARSEEEVALTIDWGLRRGLLQARPDTRPVYYEFLHELVKEAVAKQLSSARRELLHRRVARTLEQAGAKATTLAYHWGMAGDDAREAHYAALAGEQAAVLYAHDEAARYFTRALELLPPSERRVQVMSHLGDLWLLTGQWAEAERLYREAVSLAEALPAHFLRAHSWAAQCWAALGRLLDLKGLTVEALTWLEQARALATTVDDKQGLARYTGDMGRVYWRQGAYESALTCCHTALSLSREVADQAGIAAWLNTLGLIHWHQERYAQALACFEEAAQIVRTLDDKVGLATCLGNMGNIYKDQEQYEQALVYYQEALQIDRALGNKMGLARHTGNTGIVYYNLAAYDEALDYYEQALAIDRELGYQEGIARHLGNIGNIYWQWRQYAQTLIYYQQALQIDHEAGNQRGMALHLGNIGVIYGRCGAYDWALACLVQALKVDCTLGNKLGVARHLGNVAELYRQQGICSQALGYCERAIVLLEHLNNQFHLSWHHMTMAKILAAQQEYLAALPFNEAGLQAATAVRRQDVLFETEVRSLYLAAAMNQIEAPIAIKQLAILLDRWKTGEEQAAIRYEMWRLDKSLDDVREKAAALYHHLSRQTPDITYRQRYEELTGRPLPDPPPLPELPALVTASAADLSTLLTEVDQLIASL